MPAKSLFASIAIFLLCNAPLLAQRMPSVVWQQCYGGSGLENSRKFLTPHDHMMVHTSDGGYAFVGLTDSYDAPVTGNHRDTTGNPSFDLWLVKLDADGNTQWQKCFGGSQDESPRCLIQTSDGGFVMCGTTRSHDGDVTDSHPVGSNDDQLYVNDAWIVKTDAVGNKQWAHAYGTQHGDEYFNSMIEVPDGYIAIGRSTTVEHAQEGHVIDGNINLGDAMVVKLDRSGVQQWSQLYGDIISDEGFAILPFPSGGYIFAGAFGIAIGAPGGGRMVEGYAVPWVVRLDTGGKVIWQKNYQHELKKIESVIVGSMMRIPNGFLIAGRPYGFVFTIDTSGNVLSQQNFGTDFQDMIASVIQTEDSNLVFAGSTRSQNVPGIHIPGDVDTLLHNTDSTDAWVGCFTPDLRLLWQRAMGGDFRDCFYTVLENEDQSFMLYGGAESGNEFDGGNGDHPGNVNGYADAWVVKLGQPPEGVARPYDGANSYVAYPNPAQREVNLGLFENATARNVQFYDLLGTQVFPSYQVIGTRMVANAQQLPAGVYTVKVSYNDSREQIRKFLHVKF